MYTAHLASQPVESHWPSQATAECPRLDSSDTEAVDGERNDAILIEMEESGTLSEIANLYFR